VVFEVLSHGDRLKGRFGTNDVKTQRRDV
jgi:hypothetical protein